MSSKHTDDRYFPAFDSLRTFGFVAVVAAHVNECFGGPFPLTSRPHWWMSMAASIGWISVDLFFVMSGFLITGILFQARESPGFFRNFYARRALRIMPVFYAFLTFAILFSWLDFPFCAPLSAEQSLAYGLYYSNFRNAITGHDHSCFIHFWSVAVEEHFYLFWPLAVWCLRRETLMRLCLGLAGMSFLLRVAVIASGMSEDYAYFITPCRLDGLFAGSYVALAKRNSADWDWLRRWSGTMVVGSACLLLGMALGQGHFMHRAPQELVTTGVLGSASMNLTVGVLVLSVFFAGLIVKLVNMDGDHALRRVLENRWLCAFGTYSYGMYLFHFLILRWVVAVYPAHTSDGMAKVVATVLVTALSFAAGWLSYHLFEKHFLKLKVLFEYRKARPVSRQQTADAAAKPEQQAALRADASCQPALPYRSEAPASEAATQPHFVPAAFAAAPESA